MIGLGLGLCSQAPGSLAPVVTVSATATGEIEVSASTGAITITITSPPHYAGTYVSDVAGVALGSTALASGPQCLVAPRIALLTDADSSGTPTPGDTAGLGAAAPASYPGLWIYDVAGGAPGIAYRWQSGTGGIFADISGATASTRVLATGEVGATVRLVETASTLQGTRAAVSNTLGVVSASVDATVAAAHNMNAFAAVSRTLPGVALGTPAATREVFVFYAGRMSAVPVPGEWRCTVAGVATTAEVIRQVPSSQAIVLGWRLPIPTGTAGDVVLERVSGTNVLFGGAILVVRTTGSPVLGTPRAVFDNTLGNEVPTPFLLDASLPVSAGSALVVLAGMTRNSGVAITGATKLVDGGTSNGGGAAAFASGLAASPLRLLTADFAGATAGDDALLVAVEMR
jgi:hypothetical protein